MRLNRLLDHKMSRILPFLAIGALLSFPAKTFAIQPREMVAILAQQYQRLSTFEISGTTLIRVKCPILPEGVDLEKCKTIARRLNDNFYFLQQSAGTSFTRTRTPRPYTDITEMLRKDGQLIDVSYESDDKFDPWQDPSKIKVSPYDFGAVGTMELEKSRQIKDDAEQFLYMQAGRFIFGFVGGGDEIWLPDLIKEGPVALTSDESVDGFPCELLSTKNQYGDLRVWLDPTVNYLPRRVILIKHADDRCNDKTLKDLPLSKADDYRPHGKTVEIYTEFSNVQIDQIEGGPVISSCTVLDRTTFDSGESIEQTTSWTTEKLSLTVNATDPSLFRLKMPVPDGVPISIDEAPHLDYQVKGGKIMPVLDEKELEEEFEKQMVVVSTPIVRLVLLNLLLVCGGIVAWWLYRRSNTPSSTST